ncbi:hypothetical protein X777_10668 [Ooceraea biroi]|uniref:Uncharacterized protein n=1 Tax=Ooceraea biroi TaxID=2015173 RepID=A0A026W320_OOCBI|nr:hypothetical protein X777_10668 [Ooceraea biroi]
MVVNCATTVADEPTDQEGCDQLSGERAPSEARYNRSSIAITGLWLIRRSPRGGFLERPLNRHVSSCEPTTIGADLSSGPDEGYWLAAGVIRTALRPATGPPKFGPTHLGASSKNPRRGELLSWRTLALRRYVEMDTAMARCSKYEYPSLKRKRIIEKKIHIVGVVSSISTYRKGRYWAYAISSTTRYLAERNAQPVEGVDKGSCTRETPVTSKGVHDQRASFTSRKAFCNGGFPRVDLSIPFQLFDW